MLATGLDRPTGIALHDGQLFVSQHTATANRRLRTCHRRQERCLRGRNLNVGHSHHGHRIRPQRPHLLRRQRPRRSRSHRSVRPRRRRRGRRRRQLPHGAQRRRSWITTRTASAMPATKTTTATVCPTSTMRASRACFRGRLMPKATTTATGVATALRTPTTTTTVSTTLPILAQKGNSWSSQSLTDYDDDGCQDAGEDVDDDNDGICDGTLTDDVGLALYPRLSRTSARPVRSVSSPRSATTPTKTAAKTTARTLTTTTTDSPTARTTVRWWPARVRWGGPRLRRR